METLNLLLNHTAVRDAAGIKSPKHTLYYKLENWKVQGGLLVQRQKEIKQKRKADQEKKLSQQKSRDAAEQIYKVIPDSLFGDLVTDMSLSSAGHAHTLPNMKHDKRNCTNCSFTLPHAV